MPLLEVHNLTKYFPIKKGALSRTVGEVRAVDGVSFAIEKGKIYGSAQVVASARTPATCSPPLWANALRPTKGWCSTRAATTPATSWSAVVPVA